MTALFAIAARAARLTLACALAAAPLLAGAAVPQARAAQADARFVPGLGDVPVMPGLVPARDGVLVFDKPSGRIAQAVLTGNVGRPAVLAFYARTLPQLGWAPAGESRFVREGETLILEFLETGARDAGAAGATAVRLVLHPR